MTMFTIDLLKGKAVPTKAQPGGAILKSLPFVVPVLIAIAVTAHYGYAKTSMTINETVVTDIEANIKQFSADLKFHNDIKQQINEIKGTMSEVSGSIGQFSQFSNILQTLVENMPNSIFLKELELRSRHIPKNVQSKTNPDQMERVMFTQRRLLITVCGISKTQSDQAVQDYLYKLRNSKILKPMVEEIRIASSGADEFDDRNVTSYEIDCLFILQK